MKSINPYGLTLMLVSFIPHSPLASTPYINTILILQSYLSLLILKLLFNGVSQCMPTVGKLYFGSFNPLHYSPLLLYLPLPIFQHHSIHILIFSTFTDLMFYNITDGLPISFPFRLSPCSTLTNIFYI
jgi:hypothetical protein